MVANEIKELARQTAEATEDTKNRFAGVQTSAGCAITEIEKISSVIQEVGGIVSGIAAAIEEQSADQRSGGQHHPGIDRVKDANNRVIQTATVSQSIAQDITCVNRAVGEIARAEKGCGRSAGDGREAAQ